MDEIAVKFAIAKILISEVQDLNKGTNELTEIYKLMEEQLRLHVVSQHRELLEAYTKQIKEDNEFTEEITFQDINKCIASNCG